jgi:hypothetical protein
MRHLGKAVAQKYGDSLRVGVIVDQMRHANGWSYVEVAWVDDHVFLSTEEDASKLTKRFYRIDEVFFFDPSLVASSVNKLRSKIRMNKF